MKFTNASVRIVGVHAEIRITHLRNTSKKSQCFSQFAQLFGEPNYVLHKQCPVDTGKGTRNIYFRCMQAYEDKRDYCKNVQLPLTL